MDEDGEPIVGFFTVRRIVAHDKISAEENALRLLLAEEKMKKLILLHAKNSPNGPLPSISPDFTEKIGWSTYFFGAYAKGFVFY